MSVRNYGSAVPATTLSAPATNVAATITVTSSASFPTVPFVAILDRDTASEVVVLVTNVVGTTWTVTRGYDGTAGLSHLSASVVEHGVSAVEFREANAHVNATTGVHGVGGALAGVSYVDAADALKAPLASPTFTGTVVVPTPAASGAATTKSYVDTADALKAPLASPTFTGTVTVPTAVAGGAAVNKTQMDAVDVLKAPLASPTFTGTVTVPTPSAATDATTKTYVDTADALKAPIADPTFTGTVTAPTLASTTLDATTLKQATVPVYATAQVCVLTLSAAQTFFKDVWNPIDWDVEEEDPQGWHTGTGSTVTPIAGVYLVTGQVNFAGNATGIRLAGIQKNSARIAHSMTTGVAGYNNSVSVSTVVRLNGTDTVSLMAFQNSGGGLLAGTADGGCRLAVVRIGA